MLQFVSAVWGDSSVKERTDPFPESRWTVFTRGVCEADGCRGEDVDESVYSLMLQSFSEKPSLVFLSMLIRS